MGRARHAHERMRKEVVDLDLRWRAEAEGAVMWRKAISRRALARGVLA